MVILVATKWNKQGWGQRLWNTHFKPVRIARASRCEYREEKEEGPTQRSGAAEAGERRMVPQEDKEYLVSGKQKEGKISWRGSNPMGKFLLVRKS